MPEASQERNNMQLKTLYDVENNRSCRTVRELITELDLVVENVVPAAPGSRALTEAGYKYAIPQGLSAPSLVLVDPSGKEKILSKSDDICNFLMSEFNVDNSPPTETKDQIIELLNTVGSYLAGILRIQRGTRTSPAVGKQLQVPRPDRPLILYSYEGNQFCRLVREVLTELDIPYELRNAGKQSPRRTELAEITGGSTQCPYIIDPNTNVKMAESADIIRYLYKQYALWTPPSELLQWISEIVLPLAKPIFAALTPVQAGASQDDAEAYERTIAQEMEIIQSAASSHPVLIYTYELSPFSFECKALLDSCSIPFKEISLGQEWIPGMIQEGGSITRAALLQMTGQSSLPHIFVNGKSIGGLFTGTPGLLPALEEGSLTALMNKEQSTLIIDS